MPGVSKWRNYSNNMAIRYLTNIRLNTKDVSFRGMSYLTRLICSCLTGLRFNQRTVPEVSNKNSLDKVKISLWAQWMTLRCQIWIKDQAKQWATSQLQFRPTPFKLRLPTNKRNPTTKMAKIFSRLLKEHQKHTLATLKWTRNLTTASKALKAFKRFNRNKGSNRASIRQICLRKITWSTPSH